MDEARVEAGEEDAGEAADEHFAVWIAFWKKPECRLDSRCGRGVDNPDGVHDAASIGAMAPAPAEGWGALK